MVENFMGPNGETGDHVEELSEGGVHSSGTLGGNREAGEEISEPKTLAEELGVSPRPEREYQEIDELCSEIFDSEIFQGLIDMDVKNIPQYLAQHTRDILEFFNTKSANSYRFLLFLRKTSYSEALGKFGFTHNLDDAPLAQVNECFLIFVAFYLVSNITAERAKFSLEAHVKVRSGRGGLGQEMARMQIECDLRVNFSDKMVGFIWTVLGSKYNSFFETFSALPRFPKVKIESNHTEVFLVQQMMLGYVRGIHEHGTVPQRLFMDWQSLYGKVIPESNDTSFGKPFSSIGGALLSESDLHLGNAQDSFALDYFLCQEDLIFHPVFLAAFRNKSYLPVWEAWITRHIVRLADRNSKTHAVFCQVFAPEIKTIMVRKGSKWKVSGSARRNFPPELVVALETSANSCPDLVVPQPEPSTPPIIHQPAPRPAKVIENSPGPQQKIIIAPPEQGIGIHDIFPDNGATTKGRRQLGHMDLRKLSYLPPETKIFLQIGRVGRKGKISSLIDRPLEGFESRLSEPKIPIPEIRDFPGGNISYCLVLQLPNGNVFSHPRESGYEIELQYHVNSNVSPKSVDTGWRTVDQQEPKGVGGTQREVANQVAETLISNPTTINPEAKSLEMLELILVINQESTLIQHATLGEAGEVIINIENLPDADCFLGELLHSDLISHRQVIIYPSGTIVPTIRNQELQSILVGVAENVRSRERARQEDEKLAGEIKEARIGFLPMLEYIWDFDLEEPPKEFPKEGFKILRWACFGGGGSQNITLRDMDAKVKISYLPPEYTSFHIASEDSQGTIPLALLRCYEEVGESFMDLARLYFSKTLGIRQKIKQSSNAKLSMTKAYEGHLNAGNAHLVALGPGRGRIGNGAKFPIGPYPCVLADAVGYDTIEEMVTLHPFTQVLYRRSALHIDRINGNGGSPVRGNGGDKLSNQLLASSVATDILRTRVCITLGFQPASGEERKEIESNSDACRILQDLATLRNIGSVTHVTDDFLQDYIDVLDAQGIRITYVGPVCVSLEQHRRIIDRIRKKEAAKVG